MTFDAFHVAPRPNGASHTGSDGPPAAATVLSLPSAKNPMRSLVGDQNGCATPSPPSIRRAIGESSERTHNWFSVDTPAPTTNATMRPFGEIATFVESGFITSPGGGRTESRTTSVASTGEVGPITPMRCSAKSVAAATMARAATVHARRSRDGRGWATAARASPLAPDPPSAIAASAMRASPMSRSRCFTSRSRQRSSSCRNRGGVSAGSLLQSISWRKTAARTSENVSPANARLPVSSS